MKRPIIIGLTGSIGMGKSTAARMFRELGIPVFDADATVHRLLGAGGDAVDAVEAAFPGVVKNGAVDRGELGKRVFGDGEALRRLERIVHPRVFRAERRFLAKAARARKPLVVRDVPLLFETGGDRRCDVTVVVSAPAHMQAQRVLARPGMTREKFEAIRAKQLPDAQKRRRADFVVPSGLGKALTRRTVTRIVRAILNGEIKGRRRRHA